MHAIPELVLIAIAVTLTPGPGTATILRVAVRDGRRAALSATVGNSVGVLVWGCLSAVGVSTLILASDIAYNALRFGGAGVLVVLGVRSLLGRGGDAPEEPGVRRGRAGWRTGLVTSLSNPKLAVFFVALFPQFLSPGEAFCPRHSRWPGSSWPSTWPGSRRSPTRSIAQGHCCDPACGTGWNGSPASCWLAWVSGSPRRRVSVDRPRAAR